MMLVARRYEGGLSHSGTPNSSYSDNGESDTGEF